MRGGEERDVGLVTAIGSEVDIVELNIGKVWDKSCEGRKGR